jgi:hypothetical protein
VLWTCSEVQPNEADALAAVVQALTKGDAASRQERFRWIVTEGEGAAVQPGEVGRLRRGPCDLGKLGRQQPAMDRTRSRRLVTRHEQRECDACGRPARLLTIIVARSPPLAGFRVLREDRNEHFAGVDHVFDPDVLRCSVLINHAGRHRYARNPFRIEEVAICAASALP